MAPERFRGPVATPRGDVYALGLTLYELLTLRPAFDAADRERLIQQVTHERAAAAAASSIPGCRATWRRSCSRRSTASRRSRYPTAGELAEDLQRFLEDRPIRARRASAAERAWRWCRRNPVVAGLTAAVATLLIAVAVVATVAAIQYRLVASKDERLRNEAQGRAEAETKAKEELEASLYYQSHRPGPPGVVARQPRTGPGSSSTRVRRACGSGNGTTSSGCAGSIRSSSADKAEVNSVAFSPDGGRLASAGGDGTIKVWNSKTGRWSRLSTRTPTSSIPWRSTPAASTWPPRARTGR